MVGRESHGVNDPNLIDIDESLLCNEILDSFPPFDEPGLEHIPYFSDCSHRSEPIEQDLNSLRRIPDLDNIEVDTLPDFQLAVSFITLFNQSIALQIWYLKNNFMSICCRICNLVLKKASWDGYHLRSLQS
ncbi:hypothetical protein AAC387_Pa07g2201 [Persea americana]